MGLTADQQSSAVSCGPRPRPPAVQGHQGRVVHLPLSAIRVGDRCRQDLGSLDALSESIRQRGLLQPLVVNLACQLVAGYRRLEAVRRLGWETVPVYVVVGLEDALPLLLAERDENICRKDFTPSEAVAVGQRLVQLERLAAKRRQACAGPAHGPGKKASASGKFPEALPGRVRDKVGQAVGLSGRTFERAKAVVEAAANNPDRYGRLREKMDRTGKVNGVYKQLQSQQRAEAIAAEPPPFPQGPFRVVVADPPWQYGRADDPTHQGTCPYPTMPLDAILRLPVGPLACDDSILWLWTTNAHLRQAFDVAAAWGFETKTVLTWVKDRFGAGDWLRGQTEHCLLAVRGRPTVMLTNHSTVLEAPVRDHSRKPEEFYQLVEALCPGSKVELFARTPRPGWCLHGAEIDANALALHNPA